jgi:hypothetical protein
MDAPILQPSLDFHPGHAMVRVLASLHGHPGHIPADAIDTLTAWNDALRDRPAEEIEAALRRQAILLEHVQAAFLAKAAQAPKIDHQAALAKIATNAGRSLLAVLGALRTLDEARRNAGALDG